MQYSQRFSIKFSHFYKIPQPKIKKFKKKIFNRDVFNFGDLLDLQKTFTQDYLTKISEATLCKIFREIRILMSKECEKISKFSGEIEINESCFGSKRVRGKRGRGAANKTPVFGMLKRDGKVYTKTS